MSTNSSYAPHSFYIPVMGTSFTIDTPMKVAKYGISSVISLSDDVLIEKMRKHHCSLAGEEYEPIKASDLNARSMRITAYLNLLDRIVKRQIKEIRQAPFEPGSEITRYFELLPESPQKTLWREMLAEEDADRKKHLQDELRDSIEPGRIDVNIMTKVDPEMYRMGERLAPQYGLAQQALKGFAESSVRSAVVFSAGMNPGLYSYTANFDDFFPDENGSLKKEIILKVSDYRSALIQGKFLAKKGLWVSEFRVESGINCGGHAFVSKSQLMGPVLDEFNNKRGELAKTLLDFYTSALDKVGRLQNSIPQSFRITAQGGIGTAEEHDFLVRHFDLNGAGWGTPFLLVPEVISIDDEHLRKLSEAKDDDVYLSGASPLGVPFWMLRNSASEENRLSLIDLGKPGSSCPRGYLKFNKDYTNEPICTASNEFQAMKLEELEREALDPEEKEEKRNSILVKACLCRDLAGSALARIGKLGKARPVVCAGPSITQFSVIASLREMVDHIYGRISLLAHSDRPHMFIKEMSLYINRMRETVASKPKELLEGMKDHFQEFEEKISAGIKYYSEMAGDLAADKKKNFLQALDNIREEFARVRESLSAEPALNLGGNQA